MRIITAFPPCPGGRQGREAQDVGGSGPGQEAESHAGLPRQLPRRRSAAYAGHQSSKMFGSSDSHEKVSSCDGHLTQSLNHARSVTKLSVFKSQRRPGAGLVGRPGLGWLCHRGGAHGRAQPQLRQPMALLQALPPPGRGVACARRHHPDRLPRHVVVRVVGPSA